MNYAQCKPAKVDCVDDAVWLCPGWSYVASPRSSIDDVDVGSQDSELPAIPMQHYATATNEAAFAAIKRWGMNDHSEPQAPDAGTSDTESSHSHTATTNEATFAAIKELDFAESSRQSTGESMLKTAPSEKVVPTQFPKGKQLQHYATATAAASAAALKLLPSHVASWVGPLDSVNHTELRVLQLERQLLRVVALTLAALLVFGLLLWMLIMLLQPYHTMRGRYAWREKSSRNAKEVEEAVDDDE